MSTRRTPTTAAPGRPTTDRLRGAIAASLVAVPLLLAACGSSGSSVAKLSTTPSATKASKSATPSPAGGSASFSTSSGGSSGRVAAVSIQGAAGAGIKYSACMRSNGVPNFPDPNGSGATVITPSSGINPQSPQFEAAQAKCGKLLSPGGPPSPAQQAKALASALKFSACMRSHGITNFPDPASGPGGGIQLKLTPSSGLDPNSPSFQAAQTTCQKLLPGGGPRTAGP